MNGVRLTETELVTLITESGTERSLMLAFGPTGTRLLAESSNRWALLRLCELCGVGGDQ